MTNLIVSAGTNSGKMNLRSERGPVGREARKKWQERSQGRSRVWTRRTQEGREKNCKGRLKGQNTRAKAIEQEGECLKKSKKVRLEKRRIAGWCLLNFGGKKKWTCE